MRMDLFTSIVCTLFFSTISFGQDAGCATGYAAAGGFGSGHFCGGSHGQLYPYDQQDPWLHGQYQRVPSFGGYNSFRPYNYRHVAPQAQIAAGWGATNGMTYSQQFWNQHRGTYLNGNLHADVSGAQPAAVQQAAPSTYNAVSYPATSPQMRTTPQLLTPGSPQPVPNTDPGVRLRPSSLQRQIGAQQETAPEDPPIHIYPSSITLRK